MDFKDINLSKIVNLEQLEKQASKQSSNGIDKLAMLRAFAAPMVKSLPAKAKYMIGFAVLALATGTITIFLLAIKFISFLVGLAL